jgi:hypothetical protein
MNENKRTGRIVGALFLVVNGAFLAGVLMVEGVLASPDLPGAVSIGGSQVATGILLEVVNGIAYIAIAAMMFPLLKPHGASLALGYVIFRGVEFALQLVADASALAVLGGVVGSPDSGTAAISLQVLGTVLVAARQASFQMLSIAYGLGSLLFYILLYRSILIPRWISIWGLLAAVIVIANTLLDMYGVAVGNLGVLMLLNELFLGIWLLVKGLNPSPGGQAPMQIAG